MKCVEAIFSSVDRLLWGINVKVQLFNIKTVPVPVIVNVRNVTTGRKDITSDVLLCKG